MKIKSLVIGLGVSAMALTASSSFAADAWFSLNHNDLPASGAIASWGGLVAMSQPTVEVINGVKWESNEQRKQLIWDPNRLPTPGDVPHDSYSSWDGFRLSGPGAAEAQNWWSPGSFNDSIAVQGVSVVMAIRPLRPATVAEHHSGWSSLVDVFYDQFVLGIKEDTGQVIVRRAGDHYIADASTAIAEGQATILSVVAQSTGEFKVWANGVEIMNKTEAKALTTLKAGGAGNEWFKHYVNVGRNEPDGWSVFNGNIGDTYVYKSALTDAERLAMEANVAASMGMSTVPEPGSILAMMSGLIGLAGFATRRKRA